GRDPGEIRGLHRAAARGGRAPQQARGAHLTRRARLLRSARSVRRSAAKAQRSSAADPRSGVAHFGDHAGRDLVAVGAFEARLRAPQEDSMTPQAALEHGLGELALTLPVAAREQLLRYVALLAKWTQTYNLTAI